MAAAARRPPPLPVPGLPAARAPAVARHAVARTTALVLLPVDPLPPAHILEMDFTDPECGPRLIELLGGRPDAVLSDMAPNTVGHRRTDHLRIMGHIGDRDQHRSRRGAAIAGELRIAQEIGHIARMAFGKGAGEGIEQAHGRSEKAVPWLVTCRRHAS